MNERIQKHQVFMDDANFFDMINSLIQLKIVIAFHLYRCRITFFWYHPILYLTSFFTWTISLKTWWNYLTNYVFMNGGISNHIMTFKIHFCLTYWNISTRETFVLCFLQAISLTVIDDRRYSNLPKQYHLEL